METTHVSPSVSLETGSRARGRSALDIVMLAGLSLVVVADALAQIIEGSIIPPVVIAMIAYVVCGIIVATGWRWSMIFPLVLCSLSTVGDFMSGFPQYSLTHPSADYVAFNLFVLSYPLLIMVIVAAAVKLAQTLRHETPHMPQWMKPALGAVAGLILGAFLIGMTAQSPAAGAPSAAQSGTKTVHLTPANFAPDIVALHKGDTLTIVDDAPVPHTITNGTWTADNKPVPGVEPGAPVIRNVEVNNNSATVGPFTAAGTYHLYCTIHPGMALTIVVQ